MATTNLNLQRVILSICVKFEEHSRDQYESANADPTLSFAERRLQEVLHRRLCETKKRAQQAISDASDLRSTAEVACRG